MPPAAAPMTEPSLDDVILDAALDAFTTFGLRRTTVDDVAKRAGVGRVTIYRRIGGKQDLIDAALARESQRLFTEVMAAAAAHDDLAGRITASFAATVTAVRENSVWQRLLSLETDSALQQLTVEGQSVLTAAVQATLHILDPNLGAAPPSSELLGRAELLVRVTHSVLLTPRAAVPLATRDDLIAFAQAHLVPIASVGQPSRAD